MKRTLTGVASIALALGTLTSVAYAASTVNNSAKVVGTKAVVVNNSTLSNPYELTAVDSGNTTAYFGIYYFDQAIKALGTGFNATWDGNNHAWNITAPSFDASKITNKGGVGNTKVYINGTLVKQFNTFSHVDPAGGGQTTYFPVYYVNEILASIGVSGQWQPSQGLNVSAPTAPFAVKNVTAIDGEHLVVNFTRPVDKTTAAKSSNYTVSGGSAVSSAVVSSDGQSVTLTLSTPLANNAGYALTLNKGLTDAAGDVLSTEQNDVVGFYFSDKTPPSIASVAAAANGDLQIQFSEPLDASAVPSIVINGTTISNGVSIAGNMVTVAKADLPASVTNNSTDSLIVMGAKDLVGNEMALYHQNFNYTIPAAIAPSVTSLTATSENTLTATFNEPISYSQAANLGMSIQENGTAVQSSISTTDDKTFTITLPSSIYKNGSTSASLDVVFKGFKDVLNHVGTEYAGTVTMNENTAAPALTAEQYDTINNQAVFNFNMPLLASTGLTSDVTVINNANGVPVTGFAVADVSQDDTSVNLTGLSAGSYTVTFKANTVQADDILQTGNQEFTAQVTVPASTTPATVTGVKSGAFTPNSSETIAVTFSGAVHGGTVTGSATDVSNYQLNGAALPAGTTITLDPTLTTATISLPVNSVSTTATEYLTTSGVVDMNGNTVATSNQLVNLTDNTAPVLQSATVDATSGSITLTFSEPVKNFVASDFTVDVNGAAQTVTAKAGSSANEVVLSPSVSLATGTVTVTTASNPKTTDDAGNTLVGATTVTSAQ